MTKQKIQIVHLDSVTEPVAARVPCTLTEYQRLVGGGYIDVVPLAPGIDLVVNDEGLINGMSPNRVVGVGTPIYGPCFVVAVTPEGDFASLTDEQVAHWLNVFALHSGNALVGVPHGVDV